MQFRGAAGTASIRTPLARSGCNVPPLFEGAARPRLTWGTLAAPAQRLGVRKSVSAELVEHRADGLETRVVPELRTISVDSGTLGCARNAGRPRVERDCRGMHGASVVAGTVLDALCNQLPSLQGTPPTACCPPAPLHPAYVGRTDTRVGPGRRGQACDGLCHPFGHN